MEKRTVDYVLTTATIVVSLFTVFWFYPRTCEQPSNNRIELTAIGCTLDLTNEDICKAYGKASDCDLSEINSDSLDTTIKKLAIECSKSTLKKQGQCINNIDHVLGGPNETEN